MSRYRKHIDAVSQQMRCINDMHCNESFLDDIELLRKTYRKLKKEMKDKEIYPQAPSARFIERENLIIDCKNIILDICGERGISCQFYTIRDFSFKKLEMSARFVRRGVVLNEVLDFE